MEKGKTSENRAQMGMQTTNDDGDGDAEADADIWCQIFKWIEDEDEPTA